MSLVDSGACPNKRHNVFAFKELQIRDLSIAHGVAPHVLAMLRLLFPQFYRRIYA